MPRRRVQDGPAIGDRVRKNFDFLYRICFTRSPGPRWKLVSEASPEQLLAIVDVCYNILRGNMHLQPNHAKRLEQYMDHMRKLARVRSENSALKVIQKGEGLAGKSLRTTNRPVVISKQRGRGFLPALLVPVLMDVLADVAAKTVPKAIGVRNANDDDDEANESNEDMEA